MRKVPELIVFRCFGSEPIFLCCVGVLIIEKIGGPGGSEPISTHQKNRESVEIYHVSAENIENLLRYEVID